jgi:hypothetical protein
MGEEYGEGGKRRTYPFPIRVFMFAICFMQVNAIKPDNRERENDLNDAENGVRDVRGGEVEVWFESHFCGGIFCGVVALKGNAFLLYCFAQRSFLLYLQIKQ